MVNNMKINNPKSKIKDWEVWMVGNKYPENMNGGNTDIIRNLFLKTD